MRNLLATAALGFVALTALPAFAADAPQKTVAALYQERAALSGRMVSVQGKVVKANNGIMGRNFVHVQDGSGEAGAGNNNLIVTSQDTAQVGQQVAVSGKVTLNRDFGSGYTYPLLLEEASIAVK